MTFKHVKFADSPTMRALEKVAYDKGWVKPETMQKTASKKTAASLVPTDNLMTNVLKLCAGLRSQDMEKYADELETCYLNYKRAQTMYDAHGEKGEDVIHAAHPKGSHKLEDVDSSEACFEDILDRHVKMLQVVEKKPTGKLSSAKQVIDSVKIVLGQDRQSELESAIESRMGVVKEKLTEVLRIAGPDILGSGKGFLGQFGGDLFGSGLGMPWDQALSFLTSDTRLDNLMQLQTYIAKLAGRLHPGALGTGASQQSWLQVKKLLAQSNAIVKETVGMSKELNEMVGEEESKIGDPTREPSSFNKAAPVISGVAQQLPQLYNEITQSIGAAKTKVQGHPNATTLAAWFDKAQQYAKTAYETGFSQAEKNPTAVQQFIAKLTDIKAKVDRAQQKL